jgi:hypothetical protein
MYVCTRVEISFENAIKDESHVTLISNLPTRLYVEHFTAMAQIGSRM